MTSINDFKANLIGGGARANQFRVTIFSPPAIAIGLDIRRTSFLVRASTLPANQLTEIEIPFRGRKIYIAGDREFGDPWTTTFMNDTDFMIRNAMERWSNGINDLELNTGVVLPSDYQSDLVVEQMDRDDVILKSYIFRSAWPTEVTAIDLTSDAADAIEEFDVTWRYQHFEASGVNF
ncbi:tail tube protein [uncultured Mediterranean phage]|nr:tail tube protein [uncultured Mediterranean phage]